MKNLSTLPNSSNTPVTHHLTLAQRASSIPISANICIFPAVMNASPMNTTRRNVNALSTMSRKVGFRDEPGFRMSAKKDSAVEGVEDMVEFDMGKVGLVGLGCRG